MPSPTALTLKHLRAAGYAVDVVERFIVGANVKRDFLGVGDTLAVHALESGVLAIQATTRGHRQDRLRRARGRPEPLVWLKAGNRFEAWGWHKPCDRWELVRAPLTLQDLAVDGPVILPRRRRSRQREMFR